MLQSILPKLNYGYRVHDFALRPMIEDRRINILTGSVRSGKTWALHPKILRASFPHDEGTVISGWRVLVGQTKDTIYTNVLKDLFDMLSERDYHWSSHTGSLRIFDTEWRILGARDEGSEKFLRGNTVGIVVADEAVLMPEGFFKMLLTRMSPANARLYASTNPDSPMHYLKVEYLDKPEVQPYLYHLAMTMDDNPNLTAEYKASQRAMHQGMFYKRFILGLWVMAEGSIWGDSWSDDLLYNEQTRPITLKNAGGFVDHWISCDYGTNHPHVYLEFWDDGDTVWVDREWVWDSKIQLRQKTDAQLGDDLVEFMGGNSACQVIVPPDALSFRIELTQRGVWVTVANDEHEGLKTVANMMGKRKLRVHERCERLRRAIHTYIWDPNKAKRGIEEPLMQNDDENCALRYGIHGKIPAWRWTGS